MGKGNFTRHRKWRGACQWRAALAIAFAVVMLMAFTIPQAMAALTPKLTPKDTVIKNKASATYKDANGNDMTPVTPVWSNEVSTTVSQVASVDVSPATDGKSATSGGSTAYAVTVCNKGNGSDTIDLSQITTPPGTQTWTATIVNDEGQDGTYDPLVDVNVITNTGTLAADACKKVFVVVQVDANAANGDSALTTLTGKSQFDTGKTDTGTYTTTASAATISAVKSVTHIDTNSDGNIDPGEELIFKIAISNSGDATAYDIIIEDVIDSDTSYVTESLKAGAAGDSYATAGALTDADDDPDAGSPPAGVKGKYDSGATKAVFEKTSLAKGAGATFFLKVAVKTGTLQGSEIKNKATAKFDLVSGPGGTQYTSTSNETTDTVGNYSSILLDPNRSGSYDPSDQVVYDFTVTNNGNASDAVDMSYVSSQTWTWDIWVDDGDGVFETGEDSKLTPVGGVVTTPSIAANGGTLKIFAVTTVPAGTPDTTADTTTITGQSSNDASVTDPEVLTTTVTAPSLSILKEVSPTGSQPPGTTLTYTVTVTNNGTGQATTVIINDIIPTYTTYVGGSIKTGATVGTLTGRSDAADNDGAKYDGSAVVVPDGATAVNLSASGTWVVQFQVTID
ncbi:MAG: hypothetical protein NT072_10920 [Deltaproteobacteria bacterium]|nr:hypothetical protein [Deltaproteobacteria bacterium]